MSELNSLENEYTNRCNKNFFPTCLIMKHHYSTCNQKQKDKDLHLRIDFSMKKKIILIELIKIDKMTKIPYEFLRYQMVMAYYFSDHT